MSFILGNSVYPFFGFCSEGFFSFSLSMKAVFQIIELSRLFARDFRDFFLFFFFKAN
jgi:hypothetical protein